MAGQNNQVWFYVQFDMVLRSDGTTTKTFYCSNRAVIDDTNVGRYYPILKDIRGLGVTLEEYLPKTISGSIVLDNSPDSYGHERRISDFLDRYIPIDQTIALYTAQTELTDLNVSADFTKEWQGVIRSVRVDPKSGSVTLDIEGLSISRNVITKVIDSRQYPTAPSSSIGKHLPIILGANVEVRGVPITEDNALNIEFGYGTTLSTDFVNVGIQSIYAKDINDNYVSVAQGSIASAYSVAQDAGIIGVTPGTSILAVRFATSEPGYILTQGRLRFVGTGNGAWSGSDSTGGAGVITFSIFEHDPVIDAPGKEIATATELKTTWQTQFRASAEFWIDFALNKPVITGGSQYIYLGLKQTAATGESSMRYLGNTAAATIYYNDSNLESQWKGASASNVQLICDLYSCELDDEQTPPSDYINSDGLGTSYLYVEQRAALATAANPDLSKLDLVFACHGLGDNAGGDITGVGGSLIDSTLGILEVLSYEWDGSTSWSPSTNFDFSAYTATHDVSSNSAHRYYRLTRGATSGRRYLPDLYLEILQNSAWRMARLLSGKLAFYGWGTELSSTATITDENAKILLYEILPPNTVLNRFLGYYAREVRNLGDNQLNSEGLFKEYAAVLDTADLDSDYAALTDGIVEEFTAESRAIFGDRYGVANTFDFVRQVGSMATLAAYKLARYALPSEHVTIEVPYFTYRTLELLNVVTIIHPDLPAHFGTSSDPKLPSYDGTEVDPSGGFYLKRAQTRRAQIEGRTINWNLGRHPTITLFCRLLNNHPKDPT